MEKNNMKKQNNDSALRTAEAKKIKSLSNWKMVYGISGTISIATIGIGLLSIDEDVVAINKLKDPIVLAGIVGASISAAGIAITNKKMDKAITENQTFVTTSMLESIPNLIKSIIVSTIEETSEEENK